MKLVKQSFEILEQTDYSLKGIKQFIERCGRVCYKSEDRITDTSYEKFVDMLIKKDHARPLEFGTVHLKMKSSNFQGFMQALYAEGIFNDVWIKSNYNEEVVYTTTNYRYYLDMIKRIPFIKNYFTEEDNEYYPKRYTVHMILSRGVMDEFRTHVTLSHLAESTRYCNYSKDKFNNELTFVIQDWMENVREGTFDDTLGRDCSWFPTDGGDGLCLNDKEGCVLGTWNKAESEYLDGLKCGLTPQQIRSVLPLSVKSELISCGFGSAWDNFFYRRCAKDAHPMAREIAIPLQDKFKEMGLSFVY
ncbi:FAD-dependent thymidylate synthase [Prevotella sp.]